MNIFLEGLPRHADAFYLMKLKFNKMDMNKDMETIIKIIERSYQSLIDLNLSECNLSFRNSVDLFKNLTLFGMMDAKYYNNNKIAGMLRSLNLSYNPLVVGNLEAKKKKREKKIGATGAADSADSQETDELENFDQGRIRSKDTFTDILIRFINMGHCKKLTHLDLSGIKALDSVNQLKVFNILPNCDNLISVHLNHLGVNNDPVLVDQLTETFNISL